MRSFELNADANANAVHTELGKMRQEVFSKLDFIAAVTSKCLLVSVEGEVPCPRFIRVEEDASQAPTRSRFSHFRRAMMDPFLRKRGKSKGKEPTPKCYRVCFLCAHDMSAADCGPDGQGYIVESEKKWQQWLRKCLPLVQVRLELASWADPVAECRSPCLFLRGYSTGSSCSSLSSVSAASRTSSLEK